MENNIKQQHIDMLALLEKASGPYIAATAAETKTLLELQMYNLVYYRCYTCYGRPIANNYGGRNKESIWTEWYLRR